MRFAMRLLFVWLSLIIAVYSAYTPCTGPCPTRASVTELAKMTMRLYKAGPSTEIVLIGNTVDLLVNMNKNWSTIMFAHGWRGDSDLPTSQAISSAYVDRGNYNVLQLDWRNISAKNYAYAAGSVEGIGYTVAIALNELVANGLNSTGIHIIGHSLGAQICGYIGRNVNFTLSRITGLDPAGPGFYIRGTYLNSSEANYVDIIHTDRGVFGTNLQTGHADFYPNDGVRTQPGCPVGPYNCSHYRSCYFYAESVQFPDSFIGLSCNSNSNFMSGSCSSNPTVVMGFAIPINASGKYYLQTNSKELYGRGKNGTTYTRSTSSGGLIGNLVG